MRAICFVLLASCTPPVYDDRIGVTGVPTPEGSLVGRHTLVSQAADHADVPLFGPQTGGGMTLYVVDVDEEYRATATPCRVINFEVAGLSTAVSDATVRSIPPISFTFTVDHATGAVGAEGFREIWAWTPSGIDDALPIDASDARIVDMESDGKPGATITASGLANGELYIVQRKTLSFDGVVVGEDEALGLVTHKKESTVLDATDDLLKTKAERAQHPDPKESWWHLVRDADCDDESLLLRPF